MAFGAQRRDQRSTLRSRATGAISSARATLEVDAETLTPTYGKFTCEPLERGFGITLGNSLRRVLLSSLQGAAITAIRIDGALHEFTTIPDVVEDVTDIILNLKEVVLKAATAKTYTRAHRQGGPGPRLRAATSTLTDGLEVLNPDHLIATLDKKGAARDGADGQRRAAATSPPSATRRRRCRSAPSRSTRSSRPIRKVNYTVTNARVGQVTDYDKLTPRGLDQRRGEARRTRSPSPRRSSRSSSPSSSTSKRPRSRRTTAHGRRGRAAQREPLPLGRRARALGALGELPAERQHQATSASWCSAPSRTCSRPRTSAASR